MNDGTTVEVYSPTTGGTILSTRIVGDSGMAAVSIGRWNIVQEHGQFAFYMVVLKFV